MTATTDDARKFVKDGYLRVPAVLDPEVCRRMREHLMRRFASPDRGTSDTSSILVNVFAREPELRTILFNERAKGAWAALLGDDFVFLRESAAHLNMFGPGWHADTTSQERAGEDFHRSPGYLMVQTAFYLQDDSAEYGGGLEVIPGSHVGPSPRLQASLPQRLRERAAIQRGRPIPSPRDAVRVGSRTGDMVIFDFRLHHRATQPTAKSIPDERAKIAIFQAASRSHPSVDLYHAYIEARPQYEYLLQQPLYPQSLLDEAARHGVRFA